MPWFEPTPPEHDPDEWEEEHEYPGFDNYGLKSEQFIVTDNPVTGVILGPDEVPLIILYERDDRFGFAKWAEDR